MTFQVETKEAFTFLESVDILFQILNERNDSNIVDEIELCEPDIDDQLYYQLCLIPAFVILLSFCVTQKRRNVLVHFLQGRPGFIYPMDQLTGQGRLSYACAFGVTVDLVYRVVFERFYAFDFGGPDYARTIAAVISMLIYGLVFFPVFACLTIGSVYGYGFGALYVWLMFITDAYRLSDCSVDQGVETYLYLKRFPRILCLLYLSVTIPIKFARALERREFVISSIDRYDKQDTMENICKSPCGKHVQELLRSKRAPRVPEKTVQKILYQIKKIAAEKFYTVDPYFRYSSRLVTTMFVGAIILYQVVLECVVLVNASFKWLFRTLENKQETIGTVEKITDNDYIKQMRDVLEISIIIFKVIRVVVFVSVGIASALGLGSIISSFPTYRRLLRTMYIRGVRVPPGEKPLSNSDLLSGFMRYAGYQIGYIAWGFIIQAVIITIILLIIATIVCLFIFDISTTIVDSLIAMWPVPVMVLIVNTSQMLFSRLFFLQDWGRTLGLNNRRVFFIFTYFMFFYNIFMGVFSNLMRILYALVVGCVLLPRLDHSVLPITWQYRDPGYHAFTGFMMVEFTHTHPVMMTFARLLCLHVNERKRKRKQMKENEECCKKALESDSLESCNDSENEKTESRKHQAMLHWHLAYTLIHNPEIRLLRAGYSQSVIRARELGLRLPATDQVTVGDTDVIRELTADFLSQNEKKDSKMCRKLGSKEKRGGGEGEREEGKKLPSGKTKLRFHYKGKDVSSSAGDEIAHSEEGAMEGNFEILEARPWSEHRGQGQATQVMETNEIMLVPLISPVSSPSKNVVTQPVSSSPPVPPAEAALTTVVTSTTTTTIIT